ncbi:hypothetical protein [Pseudonocardia abyssalis]|jgi:hypothetical protein|uniref:Uncharacterized protein n=1 Tax=Pseudonocardia abyssalis TaxID=2792008 RepID=A0ABS6URX8_9PSEU|nr:hypothetical protein [Pseudonocardia abyssalis]MBW0116122.1 hypothetical protein [Pseudonocardia abyssalis]MBW0135019.1 hypothetical protein [Pseudonocardia abyssalis]
MPIPTDLDSRTVHSPDVEQRTEQRRRYRAVYDLAVGTGALTPLPDVGPAPVEGGRR